LFRSLLPPSRERHSFGPKCYMQFGVYEIDEMVAHHSSVFCTLFTQSY
jgi:hypothetical protein